MRFRGPIFIIFCFTLIILGCDDMPQSVKRALEKAGSNRNELEKVIKYYKSKDDKLRLKAAYFIISNLPEQYHYSGKDVAYYRKAIKNVSIKSDLDNNYNRNFIADSLKKELGDVKNFELNKVDDIITIKSIFLIQSIEGAFKAWNYPWARALSFEDFCEYLLPYKLKNEQPEIWRDYFQKRYGWIAKKLQNKNDALQVCKLINQDIRKWFYFSKTNPPIDMAFSDLVSLAAGGCPEEVQLTTYAMRSLGLAVVMDGVPMWGNRNSRHDWNALLVNGKLIPFLGGEIDPGVYKVEGALPGNIKARRSKIFRSGFPTDREALKERYPDIDIPVVFASSRKFDVTKSYIPVQSFKISLDLQGTPDRVGYLAVFNNLKWRIIDWGIKTGGTVEFRNVGRDIVYLPVLFDEEEITPAGKPLLVQKDGTVQIIEPSSLKFDLTIDRKYPTGDDNKIMPGEAYELFYWDGAWRSIGKQTPATQSITFPSVPQNALFWLHAGGEGSQERIFIVKNGRILWY